jgi:hypothetical protein
MVETVEQVLTEIMFEDDAFPIINYSPPSLMSVLQEIGWENDDNDK